MRYSHYLDLRQRITISLNKNTIFIMATQESNIFKRAMVAVSKLGTRLFRINAGRGWTGSKLTWNSDRTKLTIHNPRPFIGAPKGYPDGTGWTPVEVGGRIVAVYTAIETKTKTGRATKEQVNFLDQVKAAGGIAGIVRSDEDAVELINDFKRENDCERD